MIRPFLSCFLIVGLCFSIMAQTLEEEPENLYVGQEINTSGRLDKIALGSCNNQGKSQVIWNYIVDQDPDLWIWLGDNIYGDTEDMEVMEKKYRKQKFNMHYSRLRSHCPVIGTWDDHDFGVNDGGKGYAIKKESKQLALDFLDVPKGHASRKREGLYQTYEFGEAGEKVKIILLDTRYFRDHLEPDKTGKSRYIPNKNGDILGEQQWSWLEKQLRNSDAQLHIIGSSIQFIAEEQIYEKWANFPAARKRMLRLIRTIKPANLLFISGDRHISELAMLEIDSTMAPIYEMTASGMTHTWRGENPTEDNQYRISPLIASKNYGLIRIDWKAKPLAVEIQIRSDKDELLYKRKINWKASK